MATKSTRYNPIASSAGSSRYNPISDIPTPPDKFISSPPGQNYSTIGTAADLLLKPSKSIAQMAYNKPIAPKVTPENVGLPENIVKQEAKISQGTFPDLKPETNITRFQERNVLKYQPEKSVAVKALNNPIVQKVMGEVSKRTSGTGIASMIEAAGPKTFQEAYDANKMAQAGDTSILRQFLYQLGDTLPQTGLGVALSFVPYAGQPLSMAYWTALSADEQIRNKGKVESLNPIVIDVVLDSVLGKSIESLMKAPAKKLAAVMAQNFTVEGGTEVTQDLLKYQDAWLRAKTPEEKRAIEEEVKTYFKSGQILMILGVGGVSGAAIGGGAYGLNKNISQGKVNPIIDETPPGPDGPDGPPPPPPPGSPINALAQPQEKNLIEYPNQSITWKEMKNAGLTELGKEWMTGEILPIKIGDKIIGAYKFESGGMLDSLEILPEYRGKGISDQIMKDISGGEELKVFMPNESMINLLERTGDIKYDKESGIATYSPLTKTTTDSDQAPFTPGPGYQKFSSSLDRMVQNKTIYPEDATILKTLFEGTDDKFLGFLNIGENARIRALGRVSTQTRYGTLMSHKLEMSKGLINRNLLSADQEPGKVFTHEFGHYGWYLLLNNSERMMVQDIYNQLGREGRRKLFRGGLSATSEGGNANYYAKNVKEFFAESFATYVWENKVPAAQMKPLLERIAGKFYEGLKRLVNRGEISAVKRMQPLFERVLAGDKTTPLHELMNKDPHSFKQELQKMFETLPKSYPIEPSIVPSVPPKEGTPIDLGNKILEAGKRGLPPDIGSTIEPLEKVAEGEKRTPIKERIRILDYLKTPWRVFERMGIRPKYEELLQGYEGYVKELPVNIDKITAWSKQVSKESNERIFRFLDGEKIELTTEEAKVAGEIKTWLSEWADRLGMEPDARISEYITHIFPFGKGGEIPEEIAFLINKKIPGSVYNPFLLQRKGAEGYIKNTWKALDAYVKRATRKVHMDPALASLKEATDKMTDTSQLNYLNSYISAVNLRPNQLDSLIDNQIKDKFGFLFGARPTASIARFARQLIARAKIGASITSFAKNLTQGVNTFSEIGTRYTARGYIDLVRFGGKELQENGVLIAPFIEDRTYSAVKKMAEKFDNVLFLNMTASEMVNRGAAYYGAKAKFLNEKVTPKEFRQAFGKEMPTNYTPTISDAITYGKFVSAKTQFLFGPIDTPVGLNSDIARMAAQFQTFGLKQSEFVLHMIGDREYKKLLRYLISSMFLFAWIGGAFGMKWSDSFIPLKFGLPPAMQFVMDMFNAVTGAKDQYGNVPSSASRLRTVGTSLFTNIVPGGAQIKRSYEGIQAVNQGASKTAAGNFQYKIDKTPMNYIRGTLFGKANLSEAKAYYNKSKVKAGGTSSSRYNAQ